MKKKTLACALAALISASANAAATDAPLWMRDVNISPDGKTIAFTYRGDIFTVPVTGGQATRLTSNPSFDSTPVWSPDGSKIAFASDRKGGRDIFVMDATGGPATRLTFHSGEEVPMAFTPDGKWIVFSAAIQDPASSALYPTSRLTEVYRVPVAGGRIERILDTPAQMVSWLPDSAGFLYQDQKGMENEWRKHHTSSVTRDIWRYDAASGRHTNLTAHPGEDRNPVMGADGHTVFFLSERDGAPMNVYCFNLDTPQRITPLTDFKDHPVRFLSQGADGTLAFGWDGEIYTMRPGGKPAKVNIGITTDPADTQYRLTVSNGAEQPVASPDGKQIAFIHRGDLFVSSVDYKSIKQVTTTAQAEADPSWSKDGRTIYFTSERDGHKSIYKAYPGRADDPNFTNATIITETPLFDAADKTERERPVISPDGKKMIYLRDRSKIMVRDLASGTERQLTDGSQYPQRDGGFTIEWAPDSRWVALDIVDRRHDPYYDVAILDTETGEMINLTNSGYFDMMPHWVMDGKAILFATERYGMRNHASWGSQLDWNLLFLTRDAYDRYRLNEEDYALLQEVEKQRKKSSKAEADTSKGKKKNKKKDAKADADKADDKAKTITIDRDGLTDRVVRLTPASADMSDAAITSDGETLYYLAAFEQGYDLWKIALRDGDVSLVKKLDADGGNIQTVKDGDMMFILGEKFSKLDPSSGKVTSLSYRGEQIIDPAAERDFMLEYVRNEERERFYTPDMHGVKWDELVDHYRRFLPHIDNNYDYSVMLSELLGELNVSHTGSGYRGRAASRPTASLGLIYDWSYTGPGLKVAEVLEGGPADRADNRLVAGSVITAINGTPIDAESDWTPLFNGIAGKKTLVSFTPPDGKTDEEVMLPVNTSRESALLYKRWVKSREAYVDSISGGRLGYVHIQSMSDPSFRSVYANVLGRYNDRDGIVIDTRWNSGGRLHEDIEVLFSGEKYFTQEVRGVKTCDMPSRRWNKPSIMVVCEANYSNAHGTPWVYQHRNLGKVVGAPVPGTMTSVNWVTLQDPSLYFGIPVVGYRLADGTVLENQQLEPDVLILNDPATVVNGDDAQLRTAVETLLRSL
ncbi:MAG: peptidase S41 [Bacteroidales bacterium]|nr:peptidase S41 [Bacteroidales bacterium]